MGMKKERKKRQQKKQTKTACATQTLRNKLSSNPFMTQKQMAQTCRCSVSTIRRALNTMNYTHKKPSHTFCGSNTALNKWNKLMFDLKIQNINVHDVVSIDESSFDSLQIPNKGWSPQGSRIKIQTRMKSRSKCSLIMAVTTYGILTYNIVKGACDTRKYMTFLRTLIKSDEGSSFSLGMISAYSSLEWHNTAAQMHNRMFFSPCRK